MATRTPFKPFEENLKRMLTAAGAPDDVPRERKLLAAVRQEVRAERVRLNRRTFLRRLTMIAAAALVLIVVGIMTLTGKHPVGAVVAEVEAVTGSVVLKDAKSQQPLTAPAQIHAGQWIETLADGTAKVRLQDQSALSLRADTRLQVAKDIIGDRITLSLGSLGIEAAKQEPGKVMVIDTPAARVEVVGTKLDVSVAEKPGGATRTKVSVSEGAVRMLAAGQAVMLRSDTEATADEGAAPVRRSQVEEVNSLLALIKRTQTLAAQTKKRAGLPAVLSFNNDGSATVWTIIPIRNASAATLGQYSLRGRVNLAGAMAFSMDSGSLPTTVRENALSIDLASQPLAPGASAQIILKLPNVAGLFKAEGASLFQFGAGSDDSTVTLFELWLPEDARLQNVSPPPLETRKEAGRLVVILAGNAGLPPLVEP